MAKDNLHHHPAALPPMPAVTRILSRFDRPKLEGFITVAIGLLDVMDGEADAEDDDPGECADAREDDDPAEADDHGGGNVEDQGEIETWSHPDDHPAQLFVGKPHDHTDGPEAA